MLPHWQEATEVLCCVFEAFMAAKSLTALLLKGGPLSDLMMSGMLNCPSTLSRTGVTALAVRAVTVATMMHQEKLSDMTRK